jgi:hypothetical protein
MGLRLSVYDAPVGSLSRLIRRASRTSKPGQGLEAITVLRKELDELERRHVRSACSKGWT